MNKEKVYLKGYVVGHSADTLGYKGLQIQLENMDIVEVDENMVYKISDEPQKVEVPQFVADYIKYTKEAEWDLQEAMDGVAYEDNKDLRKWFNNNIETFARAWLDGYEVEEEELVKVRLKGTGQYLCNDETGLHFQHGFKTDFTKEYLEQANFGWVFDCPGIEIEEVKG